MLKLIGETCRFLLLTLRGQATIRAIFGSVALCRWSQHVHVFVVCLWCFWCDLFSKRRVPGGNTHATTNTRTPQKRGDKRGTITSMHKFMPQFGRHSDNAMHSTLSETCGKTKPTGSFLALRLQSRQSNTRCGSKHVLVIEQLSRRVS